MSKHNPGGFIHLYEERHHAYTTELVFYGHVTEDDADWREALKHAGHGEFTADRNDWTELRQMYARKVPTREDRRSWLLHLQDAPARGAFPVSVAFEKWAFKGAQEVQP